MEGNLAPFAEMVLRWMQRCVWRFLIVDILSDFVLNWLGDFLDKVPV